MLFKKHRRSKMLINLLASHPKSMSARPTFATLILLLFVNAFATTGHALTFVQGDYYTTTYSSQTIPQYTPAGAVVSTLSLPPTACDGLRGLAFSANNLLYTTAVIGSGFSV